MWFFRAAITQEKVVKDWKEYKSRCGINDDISQDTVSDPYEIMTHAINFAGKDSKAFEPQSFMFAMRSMFFGDGFEEVVSVLDKKSQSQLVKVQKEFDAALNKLTSEVGRGLRNYTLDKPQENGTIRKSILRIMYACKVITIVLCVCATSVAYESLSDPEKFTDNMKQVSGLSIKFGAADHAKVALGAGMIAYSLHKISGMIDVTSPSSKAEEYMDKLIDKVDKGFNDGMKQVIASLEKESYARQRLDAIGKYTTQLKDQGKTFTLRNKKVKSEPKQVDRQR